MIDVVVPTVRATAYLEVDDAKGRAWAAAMPVDGGAGEMPRATVRVPKLAPGLYWAVEAGDPVGCRKLGPGTVARPFFVAATDEAALAFGTDRGDVRPPARSAGNGARRQHLPRAGGGDTRARGGRRSRGSRCSTRATRRSVPAGWHSRSAGSSSRWSSRRSCFCAPRSRRARSSTRWRRVTASATGRLVGRAWTVGIGLLVAMLGFALLAAFLARVG